VPITTSAQVHQVLLDALFAAPMFARPRLVARLASPEIGNADPRRLYVFIPDLHLVSTSRSVNFSYGTNATTNLYRALFRVAQARARLAAENIPVDVVQLGDLFDLWRDGHGAQRNSVTAICNTYPSLLKLLYRAPRDPNCLRARLLVGNHDAEMVGSRSWSLRMFLPKETSAAFCLAMHGDWFDPVERLPNWLNRAGLLFAGNLPQAATYPLAELRALLQAQSTAANGFANYVQNASPVAVGAPVALTSARTEMPAEHNVQRKGGSARPHKFLDDARLFVDTNRNKPGSSAGFTNVRTVVIGHTHHARISVDTTAQPAMVLMDCGAWIEKYVDDAGDVRPSCQIGVISGNDARIYQLDAS